MIYGVKFYKGKESSKDHWRFCLSLRFMGEEFNSEGWRYWPASGCIKPPLIPQGNRGEFWTIKTSKKILDFLVNKMKAAVEDYNKSELLDNGSEEKRNIEDSILEEHVINVFLAGDQDVLARFMDKTPEEFEKLGWPVPTKADKDYVLRRLKEVVNGSEE